MSISKRSQVPKWQKRGEGKVSEGNFPKGEASKQHMNFKHARARKPRPDTGKKITRDQSYHKKKRG